MSAVTGALGPWLRRFEPRPAASYRLICFPHAGGGAGAYRSWNALLPPSVELLAVQYPGREDRFPDPLVDDMDELAGAVAAALRGALDRPYMVFGHSMGAAVAYETVHLLRPHEPAALFVSGRPAPDRFRGGDVHRRDDEGLIDELTRLGGTDRDVLADPALRRAVLAYVRNDYKLIENYRPRSRPPLTCPLTVLTGADDPELPPDQAGGWARLTSGRTEVLTFPGGHFYLVPRRSEVVAAIVRRLDPALVHTSPWP
ncbi:pyochelin biosynthetic protein PchC [Thermocatellispora tengchongensis]|uniref:Pyochelin biosynthetic protein PchC n=1 Tax=Thermocatellispora tengchongensis TaxID=1073253 RepID=A0A840PHD6_9ACTN|nr:alpha/beta fold hydrolase [Thermocatellispora tengchongensis]MBB5135445.1 pyochelin biosynthetic protein PchC [Thermocatellispora tengchongensis]